MNILGRLGSTFTSKVIARRNNRLARKQAYITRQKNEALEKVRRKMEESKELRAIGNKIAAAQKKLDENAQKLKQMRRMYMRAALTHRRKNIAALKNNKLAIAAAVQTNVPNKMNRVVHNNAKKEGTNLANVNKNVLGSQAPANLRGVNMRPRRNNTARV